MDIDRYAAHEIKDIKEANPFTYFKSGGSFVVVTNNQKRAPAMNLTRIYNGAAKTIGAVAIVIGAANVAVDPTEPIGWAGIACGGALLQRQAERADKNKLKPPSV